MKNAVNTRAAIYAYFRMYGHILSKPKGTLSSYVHSVAWARPLVYIRVCMFFFRIWILSLWRHTNTQGRVQYTHSHGRLFSRSEENTEKKCFVWSLLTTNIYRFLSFYGIYGIHTYSIDNQLSSLENSFVSFCFDIYAFKTMHTI